MHIEVGERESLSTTTSIKRDSTRLLASRENMSSEILSLIIPKWVQGASLGRSEGSAVRGTIGAVVLAI
jgi:hypothetical protein